MKTLGRVLSILLVLSMMLTALSANALAAASDFDPILSTEKLTLYWDSTVDDILSVYGAEKLKTISRFDGNAYSFYNDGYSDYLYIETTSSGKLAMFAVFGNFSSFVGNSGDRTRYTSSSYYDLYTSGWDDPTVWAAMALCYRNLSTADQELAVENYAGDVRYSESIAQHTAIMWNAISAYSGKTSDIQYDERAFYTNRQLMENGSSFRDYCELTGDSSCYTIEYATLSSGYRGGLKSPNPLSYAYNAKSYTLPADSCILCDEAYQENGGMRILGSLRKSYFQEKDEVPYTDEEIALIGRMQEMYAQSIEQWNAAAENYYVVRPQFSTLPLEAGEINPESIEAALLYLNAIRIGAGLPELDYSAELNEGCQCKAALTNYLGNNNPNPHDPPQPAGVSDEFYAKAQSGSGENLYNGSSVLVSIMNALDDGQGDAVNCGHRYNLLNPYYQSIGLGGASGQCVHKFSGNQPSDVDVVAWPSKGVMMSAAGGGNGSMYTVRFYNSPYSPTDESGIIFKCLNTGEEFSFESGMENTSTRGLYQSGNMVSYYDKSIAMAAGNVYEITVTNVRNDQTGEITDYSYRSVYVNLYEGKTASDLTLSSENLSLRSGTIKKLSAVIRPDDASNKMVRWSSGDPGIAVVNENGFVTGIRPGTTTVTARTDNGICAECTVTVREAASYDETELLIAYGEDSPSVRTATLTNHSGESITVKFVLAAYNSKGRMTACCCKDETVGDRGTITAVLNTPPSTDHIKAFVLDPVSFSPLRSA